MEATNTSRFDRLPAWAIGAGLVVVVVLVYARTLSCSWVAFDDLHHVLSNPVVTSGLTAKGLTAAFATMPASLWIPVTWISFMAEWSVFGGSAWGYHLVNVLLHAANAVLLWRLLEAATKRRWPSLLVAALFALHPLNVESVAWITERKNTLSTLFWILSLRVWLAYGRSGSVRHYLGAFALFLLGGMAKPMIVTLPATLLLLDWWPLGRWRTVPWTRLLLEKVPFGIGSLGFTAVTLLAHSGGRSLPNTEALSLGDRLLNVLTSYGIYLRQMILPMELSVLYRHPLEVSVAGAVIGAVIIAAVSVLARQYRKSRPEVLWGWSWYLLTLLPVVGFFGTGSEASADRFAYVPLIGPFVAIAWLIADYGRKALVPVVVVLVIFAGASVRQIGIWRDSLSLFARVLEVNPDSFRAVSLLAYMSAQTRNLDLAEKLYLRALELNPESAPTWDSFGGVLQQRGRTKEAIEAVQRALAINPKMVISRCNLASALEATGDKAGAETHWRQAVADAPELPMARFRLGKLLAAKGAKDEAREHLSRAAELDPTSREIQNALADLQEAAPAR